jgi:hypothetical protein
MRMTRTANVQRSLGRAPFRLPLGALFPTAAMAALKPVRDSRDGDHVDDAAGMVRRWSRPLASCLLTGR